MVAVTCLFVCQPALADTTSTSSPGADIKSALKGTAGVVWGLTAGLPIKSGHYIYSESHRMIQTLRSDFSDKAEVGTTLLARTMGIPYGIVSGTVLGLVKGIPSSVVDGYNQPFSKKSIGLE
jgi:hypothetical protein